MKLTAMVLMAAMGGSVCAAQTRNVRVCMDSGNDVRARSAQVLASKIFAGIRVGIEWSKESYCPSSPDVIKVSLSYTTPNTRFPNALAYALPYEGTHIEVFYDRLKQRAEVGRVPQLLAHVIVHEVTHILQGISRHSVTGIMKATWDSDDFFEIRRDALDFTSLDVELIYQGVDARTSRARRL